MHPYLVIHRKKNFKLLSRWNRDPYSRHKMFASVCPTCWRCGSAEETYLHLWWDCNKIQLFWSRFFSIHGGLYNQSLTPTPETALLSMLPGSIASQKRNWLSFSLSVARQLIPLFWKTTTTPTPPLVVLVGSYSKIYHAYGGDSGLR